MTREVVKEEIGFKIYETIKMYNKQNARFINA